MLLNRNEIIQLRRQAGFTQRAFAQLIGVHKNTMSLYEKGRPSLRIQNEASMYFSNPTNYKQGGEK